jgi:cathepsin D
MPGMTIGLANKVSPDFANDPADGILGLGYRAIASAHQKPFIVRAAEQNHLSRPIASFAFGRRLSGTDNKSEMRIGAVNRGLYSGKTTWYPVTQQAYWQFAFDSFAAQGKNGLQRSEGIIDTGTSLIAMPAEDAATFWADVPDSQFDEESGTYTFPCSTKVNAVLRMPGGQTISLNNKDINLGTDGVGSPRCVGAITASNTPGQTIFGLAMLKNIYTVLDFGQNRIGLATLNL